MAKTEIYYFSGTGNSLVVARSLSERLAAKLIPVVPLLKKDTVHRR
jgi:flavodoxin